MSDTRTLDRSFAGGEITPELYGRVDLVAGQTSVALARNFRTLPHGPAQNRAGFEYINEVKFSAKKTRLISFSFNTAQTYVLEFGEGYIRFHTNKATLLAASGVAISAVSQANPGVFTYVGTDPVVGAWHFLSGFGGMTRLNGRYIKIATVNSGAKTYTATDLAGNNIDTTAYPAYTGGGVSTAVYEVATTYLEGELFDIDFEQSADTLTLVHQLHAPALLSRLGASNWTLSNISFVPTIGTPGGLGVVASPASGATSNSYTVTAIANDGLEEGNFPTPVAAVNDLTAGTNANTVSWSAVSGAVRYNVYKLSNGLYGYIGQTAALSFVDRNITPNTAVTPPNVNNPFPGASDYPGAISYFDQRKVFADTINRSQNFWLTRSGTEANMTFSIPTQDDDSIAVRIAARQANPILHIVPLADLILLTANAEWRVAALNSDVLTPSSVSAKPQSYVGSSKTRPVVTSSSLLYVQAQGSRIWEMSYSWQSVTYQSNEASILAPHLFDNYIITDFTYSRAPIPTAWAVRSDGVLLGLTYVPNQKVLGWHHHDTAFGSFESVTCISENAEDVLYAVINRTVNARQVRYIERLHTRFVATPSDAFFVDAGVSYNGAPVNSIVTGLWHLEGMAVSILADAAVQPPQVVTGGVITLPSSLTASKIQIGLPITADLQTLPPALQVDQAVGAGKYKNIDKVYARVNQSSGFMAGPTFSELTPFKQRTTENYGTPPALISAVIELNIQPSWNADAYVCIRTTDPLPLTISALAFDVAMGG